MCLKSKNNILSFFLLFYFFFLTNKNHFFKIKRELKFNNQFFFFNLLQHSNVIINYNIYYFFKNIVYFIYFFFLFFNKYFIKCFYQFFFKKNSLNFYNFNSIKLYMSLNNYFNNLSPFYKFLKNFNYFFNFKIYNKFNNSVFNEVNKINSSEKLQLYKYKKIKKKINFIYNNISTYMYFCTKYNFNVYSNTFNFFSNFNLFFFSNLYLYKFGNFIKLPNLYLKKHYLYIDSTKYILYYKNLNFKSNFFNYKNNFNKNYFSLGFLYFFENYDCLNKFFFKILKRNYLVFHFKKKAYKFLNLQYKNLNILNENNNYFNFYKLFNFFLKYTVFVNDKLINNFYSQFYFINLYKEFLFNQNIFKNTYFSKSQNFVDIYNNHYPIFFLKSNFINFFEHKSKKTYKFNNIKYIQYYIIGFFENIFNKKISIKIVSNNLYNFNNLYTLQSIFEDFKYFNLKILRGFNIIEFLEIIWISLQNKDNYLLLNWFKKIMELMHFKNHKKFLNLFKLIFIKYSHIFIENFKISGFYFDIRGKVGVAGNSKKRHFFFKIGKINLSKKNTKVDHQQNIVNTSFGVLGVTMILSF
jgi:hypothetical protein